MGSPAWSDAITVDGKQYSVAHRFGPTRCLVSYDGLYVFVDQAPDGTWDLSGQPATPEEMPILEALNAPLNDKSVVTVTPPDASDPN